MQPRVPGTLSMFSRKIHWLTENKIQHFTFKDTHIKNHAYQKYDHADQRVRAPNSTNQLHYVHSEYYFAAEAGQPASLFCRAKAHRAGSLPENVLWGFPETKAHDPWWPTDLQNMTLQPTPTSPCLDEGRFFLVIFRLLHSFAYLHELGKFPTDHRVHLEKTNNSLTCMNMYWTYAHILGKFSY